MEDAADFIAKDIPQHDEANTFEATTCGTRTATNKHTNSEDDPCDMRPLPCVIVEHTRCCQERDYLEQTGLQGITNAIVATPHQNEHNHGRADDDDPTVKPEFCVLEEFFESFLEDSQVKQGKTGTAEEHEGNGGIVNGGAIKIASTGIVCGKASCSGDCHGVVDTIKTTHALKKEK